jgi:hypothetical protein
MNRLLILPLLAGLISAAAAQEAIDWQKARQLHQKAQRGDTLTPEERAYYEKAKAARAKGSEPDKRPDAPPPKPPVGLVPLTDMTANQQYKGEDGGLYGGGSNTPPADHLRAALDQAAAIRPLNASGQSADDGKIVLLSIGMSNTTQEFSGFARRVNQDAHRRAGLVVVDGAQGGQAAAEWARPSPAGRGDPWKVLDERLQSAGVSRAQVQVVWIKQANKMPAQHGEFPRHADVLKQDMAQLVAKLKAALPNLRIAYLSGRTYAGYARSALNPEPYAYESAFAMRWLIQDQIKGEPALNWKEGKAPLLLWGPYLWADGTNGRKIDDLKFAPEDFASDGTHPSDSGRAKVVDQLQRFFTTDATAKAWFVAR